MDYEASLEGSSPRTRYRPSRSKSAEDTPPSASSSCADSDRGSSRKSKSGRRKLKKSPKSEAFEEIMILPPQSEDHEAHWEDDTSGYTPSLGQIPEATESRAASRRGLAISSTAEPRRRRRYTDDGSLSRARTRPKHGSLQRRATILTKSSNPSLVSLLSGLTQSSVSSGSNTTITERSYRTKSDSSRRRRYGKSEQHQETASDITSTTNMESAGSDVFQYLSEDVDEPYAADDVHSILPQASTTSSNSSEDSQAGHGASSSAGETEVANDTPRSSPTLARKASGDESQYVPHYRATSKKPLYQSSFVHGPGDDEGDEEAEQSDETVSDEGSVSAVDSGHEQHSTLKAASPPGYSSTPSQHSDPHDRRLRQQEREHANHVFRAPQPQRDFHFEGAPSPSVQPPMPYYDPRMHAGASPTEFSTTASQASAWPPQPAFPPPLAIGYSPQSAAAYPHMSPQAGQVMPMALRSPMDAQSGTGQAASPILPHSSAQLTHYQPPTVGAEVTRSTVSGYELLAHKLSESSRGGTSSPGTVTPVYRKFEQLNHRVLLHLQDEICELEEELRYLDRCIAQISPRDGTGHVQPASRRGDARYGNELHHRRTELLGRVFQKLEQYSEWGALLCHVTNAQLTGCRSSTVVV